ncbi:hypothetical protein C7B62_07040 [Pleurocapsa sp. CCALA 161]|nr:hypothetical protein C7B62_07040 [Pleurocapsa sp. CCALA 161]
MNTKSKGLSWVRSSFFLFQLSLLPLLITINPVVAETKSDWQSQHGAHRTNLTAANAIQDIPTRHQVSTLAKNLLAQQNKVTRVTGVELKQTNSGLEVILKTAAGGQRLVPLILPEGNKLEIDILDATLGFSIRNGVTKTNPVEGIKSVALTKVDESSIRLTITGSSKAPSAEIIPSRQNLVLSVTPEGNTAQTKPDEEIEIIATGEATAEDSYNVPDATTATRTDTPLRDVPQSIQVVPEKVIEDQGIVRISDAVRNVSGVTPQRGFSNLIELFNIRGFDSSKILRNGLSIDGDDSRIAPNIVDRVEVLKGPASVLYGQAQPGGVVNYVTKKPLKEPSYNLELTAGNFGFIEPSLDISGPLTADKKLTYRFNLQYQNGGNFRDFVDSEILAIAPTISYQFSRLVGK